MDILIVGKKLVCAYGKGRLISSVLYPCSLKHPKILYIDAYKDQSRVLKVAHLVPESSAAKIAESSVYMVHQGRETISTFRF
jgi:hypothetical protein